MERVNVGNTRLNPSHFDEMERYGTKWNGETNLYSLTRRGRALRKITEEFARPSSAVWFFMKISPRDPAVLPVMPGKKHPALPGGLVFHTLNVMRVISGIYGGRGLKSPPDNKTRPTSDRLRETIFNVLAPRIDDDTRFVDICAGTGAIGIEALSRGAAFVTFVDRSKRSCALIEENLDKLGVPEEQTEILGLDAENFAGREHKAGWDIAFFDPPYDSEYGIVLHEFGFNKTLLNDGGILIVEHHSKTPVPDAVGSLRRWRILKQGETSLSFYERD